MPYQRLYIHDLLAKIRNGKISIWPETEDGYSPVYYVLTSDDEKTPLIGSLEDKVIAHVESNFFLLNQFLTR